MKKKVKVLLPKEEVVALYKLNETFLNKKGLIIAGIDQSLTATGVVVMDSKGKILCEKLIVPKKLKGVKRLQFIRNNVLEILKEYQVSKVAIEGYSMGSRGRSVFDLGELGGVLRLSMYDYGFEYIEISPSSLKAFIAENGGADKSMMKNAVMEKYKLEISNDNICDAFGLGRMLLVLGEATPIFCQKGGSDLLRLIRNDYKIQLF